MINLWLCWMIWWSTFVWFYPFHFKSKPCRAPWLTSLELDLYQGLIKFFNNILKSSSSLQFGLQVNIFGCCQEILSSGIGRGREGEMISGSYNSWKDKTKWNHTCLGCLYLHFSKLHRNFRNRTFPFQSHSRSNYCHIQKVTGKTKQNSCFHTGLKRSGQLK